MKLRALSRSLCALALSISLVTVAGSAHASTVTSSNNAICNQTVSSTTGVTATRLAGGDCLVTFTNAGVTNSWTVPTGVTSIQLLVVGGGGGGGIDGGSGGGGGGAYQTSSTPVSPSASYSIYVGNGGAFGNYGITTPQPGESSTITVNGTLFAGLGGAAAANGISTNPQPAAALGGSYIGTGGTGYNGATGGAGVGWVSSQPGPGSNGNPGNLTSAITDTSTVYGGSGAGGGCGFNQTDVTVRTGGAGGGGNSTYQSGGTYYSATNGAPNTGGGGGGGLSYASPTYYKSSGGGGSGIVILRYTPNTNTSISLNLGSSALTFRQATSITAYTGMTGTVNFKANGKYIPGCRNKPSNAGNSYTATCSFKPAVHNSISVSATFTPTDNTYQASTTTGNLNSIKPRVNTR